MQALAQTSRARFTHWSRPTLRYNSGTGPKSFEALSRNPFLSLLVHSREILRLFQSIVQADGAALRMTQLICSLTSL